MAVPGATVEPAATSRSVIMNGYSAHTIIVISTFTTIVSVINISAIGEWLPTHLFQVHYVARVRADRKYLVSGWQVVEKMTTNHSDDACQH